MVCPKCGRAMTNEFMFCPGCGTSVSKVESIDLNEKKNGNELQIDEAAVDMPADSIENTESTESTDADTDASADVLSSESQDAESNSQDHVFPADENHIEEQSTEPISPETEEPSISEPVVADNIPEAPEIPHQPVLDENSPESTVTEAPAISPEHSSRENITNVQGVPFEAHTDSELPESFPPVAEENKPITTAGTFFSLFFYMIPVIGLLLLVLVAFSGKRKSRKNLARALLIYRCIFIGTACLGVILLYFLNQDLMIRLFDNKLWDQVSENFRNVFFR